MPPSLSVRAHAAVEELQADPIRFLDRAFFVFGTLASGWLAFLLIHQLINAGWWHLWYFIPFWLTVTYLLLPRIHTVLSRMYLPDYFIGRTRTREGVLGDPVNLGLRGSADQVHSAMMRAGWHYADELDTRSSIRIVTSTLRRTTYPDAPVSSLYLFGERQAFTYQQEVEANPAKRHHVRFWPTPEGWLLPGGTQVDWLAAGTYDRAVGLSKFTWQVTHRIAADVDTERDHIVDTLLSEEAGNAGIDVTTLKHFASGYHHRNGGGDRIQTDGHLPIVDLGEVAPAPDLLAKLPEAGPPSPAGDHVPMTITFGVLMMVVRVIFGAVSLLPIILAGPVAMGTSSVFRELANTAPLTPTRLFVAACLAAAIYLGGYLVFAFFIYRGHSWARTLALAASTASTTVWIVSWFLNATERAFALNLWGAAAEILVLLALSSDRARFFVEARERRSRDGAARENGA